MVREQSERAMCVAVERLVRGRRSIMWIGNGGSLVWLIVFLNPKCGGTFNTD
jgi:hypothetical protein